MTISSADGGPATAAEPVSPRVNSQDDLHDANSGDSPGTINVIGRVNSPRVSVVIPALNEAANLRYVLLLLPPSIFEVVLVDGRSLDATVEVTRSLFPNATIVHQPGRGKGNALAAGFAACRGEIIVMLDADGSANPQEIGSFVSVLLDGADFAKGTRFAIGGGSADLTWLRRIGNNALVGLVNLLYRQKYTDLCYGLNAFWVHCLPHMSVDSDGFEVEALINVRLAKSKLKVQEVGSYELRRLHGNSKLHTIRDGFRVLRVILRERLSGPKLVASPVPELAQSDARGEVTSSVAELAQASSRTMV
ncbi:MAG: glycosyltransferase family 2 protein [Candidatus Dormibacteria bacterium]